eukprot:Blabericola_migrator_1__4714@NODE_2489_length_2689_cov_18_628146_g1560_i0_p2_GENE_NODE_2489_length_2689_cov_18_628146_g1560_i0NODE_2489_length_2689_cov_18_628146_g1560_i0_p2_ORF_typecomplete_len175_score39_09FtsK_4TM/PF13491_6/54FtsK_4TM/PF13491_6/0_77HupE_UreJ/PF04955_12/0_034HupE_UreJ/PF04955_12/2_7e03_NODE_2489_length_2689_cov_18_628146_g1560_i021642688
MSKGESIYILSPRRYLLIGAVIFGILALAVNQISVDGELPSQEDLLDLIKGFILGFTVGSALLIFVSWLVANVIGYVKGKKETQRVCGVSRMQTRRSTQAGKALTQSEKVVTQCKKIDTQPGPMTQAVHGRLHSVFGIVASAWPLLITAGCYALHRSYTADTESPRQQAQATTS